MKSKLHSPDDLDRARFELDLHSKLSSPHIIPFLGGEETDDSVIIVTPLAQGDLNSFTANKVLSEANCSRLCHQLLVGLDYLHSLNLVHGDIKPQNVLVFLSQSGKYTAKFCDFGFTEKLNADCLIPYQGMRGSLGYFSPEQLHRQAYGQPVDMFALGVMMFTLLCGYEPFFPSNRAGLLSGDEGNDAQVLTFESPYWDSISIEAKRFVQQLLHGDPGKRLTARQALASDWMVHQSGTVDCLSGNGEDADIQFA